MTSFELTKLERESMELRGYPQKSLRPISVGAEQHMYMPYRVLNYGMVRLVDYMGNDEAVVQAARVSYGKGTKTLNEDKGLIQYLMRHLHTTPFEMCEAKFHLKMPIFVARQWIRHRTANVNEYSARYSILDNEFYVPEVEQLTYQSTENHQGRNNVVHKDAQWLHDVVQMMNDNSFNAYEYLLGKDDLILNSTDENGKVIKVDALGKNNGISRELARTVLTLNIYTQMYWKIDLHNLLHFLQLRADPHAQYEIRVFADQMCSIVKDWVPHTYEAFENYRKNAARISANGIEYLKLLISGINPEQAASQLSIPKRELTELNATFGIK